MEMEFEKSVEKGCEKGLAGYAWSLGRAGPFKEENLRSKILPKSQWHQTRSMCWGTVADIYIVYLQNAQDTFCIYSYMYVSMSSFQTFLIVFSNLGKSAQNASGRPQEQPTTLNKLSDANLSTNIVTGL